MTKINTDIVTDSDNVLAMVGAPGIQEMVVIFLIVLLLFGAKKIPEMARSLGRAKGEFESAKSNFNREIEQGEREANK